MKVLFVGGSGMIGSYAVPFLQGAGFDVTISARHPVGAESAVAGVPLLQGDYVAADLSSFELGSFDAVVFAAGNDIRHIDGQDAEAFWEKYQSVGVPRFAAAAKAAGVKRFVQLGSYYHQAMPELCATNIYVNARRLADENARALADENFNVSTLNPPSIVGIQSDNVAARFTNFTAWAFGNCLDIPDAAPPGGTNFMSARSLSEAIAGALRHAEPGKAYLIGDENLTFAEYFQYWVDAVGRDVQIGVENQEHPLQPDASIVPGRGSILSYELNPEELQTLAYSTGDVRRAVEEIVAQIAPRRAQGN